MNEHMRTSRVEQLKHIESKVRRYNKKFQAARQSFNAQTEGERGSEQREQVLRLIPEQITRQAARELHMKSSARNNFDNRVCRRVRF